MQPLIGPLQPPRHRPIPNRRSRQPFVSKFIPKHTDRSSDDIEMSATPPSHRSEDEEEREDEEMSDLFGNDNDVDELRHARPAPASPTASGPESERIPSPERERRQALEYEEEDIPPEMAIEVKEAEVKFPNLPVPRSSDGDNWVLRIPNYMSMDTKPFSPETYVGPDEEEDALYHENTIKLKVENTLRWRWKKDELGQDTKQSNARVIRWSDGTLSLRLGKELFDINQSIDTSAATPRQTIGAAASSQSQSQGPSQSQSQIPAPADGKGQGLTYLVAQHKRSQVLQSEALVTGYMSLRPTGMTSETHRMLVRSVEQKHKQTARLRIAPEPTVDPEREKMELMKQSARSKPKRRNADLGDGFEGTRKRKAYRRQQDRDVYWSDDDEPEGMYGGGAGSDEELDFSATRGSPRKGGKRKSEAEKDEEEYQADDFVVPDEEDDEGSGGRKQGRDQSEAEDDLERMEANIEKQAAAERKGRGSEVKKPKRVADSDEDADGMDVESEEDADDHKVRRVTSKRAIAFDEDEDDE